MAKIIIDFTQTTPTFSPNPFDTIPSESFRIKVVVPPGYGAPTLSLPSSADITPGLDQVVYYYTCTAPSSAETVTLTATLPSLEKNAGQMEREKVGGWGESKTTSGTIEVSNTPPEE